MMKRKKHDYQAIVSTPFGVVGIKMQQSVLRHIDLLPEGVAFEVEEDAPVNQVMEENAGVLGCGQGDKHASWETRR